MECSDKDKHIFDPFVRKPGDQCVMLSVAITAFFMGLIISLLTKNWEWIARFSSVMVVSGLLLTMSPIFKRGVYISHSQAGYMVGLDESGKHKLTTEDDREIGQAVLTGILLSIMGTLAWGFGDVFFEWFFCWWMGASWCS